MKPHELDGYPAFPIKSAVFHRMIEAGLFGEKDHVELIHERLMDKGPKTPRHAACRSQVLAYLASRVGEEVGIQVQGSIYFPDHSQPEPDIALLRYRDDFHPDRYPLPDEVLLIIEIADSSLDYDRHIKGPLYAEAGIPAYWIINLQAGVIEAHTQPLGDRYKTVQVAERGERLSLPTSDLEVLVDDWLV